jgi:hypothetical protein
MTKHAFGKEIAERIIAKYRRTPDDLENELYSALNCRLYSLYTFFKKIDILNYLLDKEINLVKELLKIDGNLLQYINEQTAELCLIAVNETGKALQYVKDKTLEICSAAINENPWAIGFIEHPGFEDEIYEELCFLAINKDVSAFQAMRNPSQHVIAAALGHDPMLLRYVKLSDQTYDMCLAAVRAQPKAFKFVNRELQMPELCILAVQGDPDMLEYVVHKTSEIYAARVKAHPYTLNHTLYQTPEMCLEAFDTDINLVNAMQDDVWESLAD